MRSLTFRFRAKELDRGRRHHTELHYSASFRSGALPLCNICVTKSKAWLRSPSGIRRGRVHSPIYWGKAEIVVQPVLCPGGVGESFPVQIRHSQSDSVDNARVAMSKRGWTGGVLQSGAGICPKAPSLKLESRHGVSSNRSISHLTLRASLLNAWGPPQTHARCYTRPTNAYSTQFENHCPLAARHTAWYDFVRIDSAVRMAPPWLAARQIASGKWQTSSS